MSNYSIWVGHRTKKRLIEEGRKDPFTTGVTLARSPGRAVQRDTREGECSEQLTLMHHVFPSEL